MSERTHNIILMIVVIVTGFLTGVLVLEAFVGCGKGEHSNQCLFINDRHGGVHEMSVHIERE